MPPTGEGFGPCGVDVQRRQFPVQPLDIDVLQLKSMIVAHASA